MDTPLTSDLQRSLENNSYQYPGNVGRILDRSAGLHPTRNGIIVPGEALTFEEYYDRVCRMVHGLQNVGLQRNDRVLLISPNSLNYAFISLAVFRIGAVLVPANPRIRHYELAHIISEAQPKLIICESSTIPSALKAYELIREVPSTCFITLDEKAPSTMFIQDLDLSRATTHCETMTPDDTAMIVYTAAMDGYALGAELTHASIFYDTVSVSEEGFKKDDSRCDVVSCIAPLFHTYGFTTGLLVPLAGGVTCLLLNTSLGARKIVSIMETYQATQIYSVPAIYFSIMKPLFEEPSLCARLNNLTSGGIRISSKLLERYQNQLGLPISEGYGLTETSPVVTWNGIDSSPKFGTVGYPLACCQAKVIDDAGNELPPGHEGEVLVRGLNLFSGYLNQPGYTENSFVDGWFKTGDLGRFDNEHYLTLTGLKKDMINVLGLKVYPKEVERILLYHPDIRSAHICEKWDEKFGNIVAGEISLKPGRAMSPKDFQNWCRDNISPYKIPRRIAIHD
ncbi:MAG: AMP-binding protein [Deltaproteobacteria bacterium]|nr:AMP-binding protein [Deltaproteobacteria bacterium]